MNLRFCINIVQFMNNSYAVPAPKEVNHVYRGCARNVSALEAKLLYREQAREK